MSHSIVILFGLYLLGLAGLALVRPASATAFLQAHASSPKAHYAELVLRLLVGIALVRHSPLMAAPTAFLVFGWVLIVSTTVLALLPWTVHRKIAERSVPLVASRPAAFAAAAALLGVAVIAGLALGAGGISPLG